MPVFVYFIIGAVIFGLFLKFSIGGVKRMAKFVMLYDDPDAPLHSRKSMTLSVIPYFLILFCLVVLSSFGVLVFFVVLPAWLFTFFFSWHYMKLWKYHKRSVLLLIFASLVWLAGCFTASGFVKGALTEAVNFLRSLL
ncbi:MAG: hypothetical protein FWD23_16855 [Oscillospiraceae bacterium]|nr:hypothetical protein [Oscillospiraceae bacterium]